MVFLSLKPAELASVWDGKASAFNLGLGIRRLAKILFVESNQELQICLECDPKALA